MVKIDKKTFLAVGLLTAAVFAVGLAAGYMLDMQRTSFLADEIRAANLRTERFVVGQQYIQQVSPNTCDAMQSRLRAVAEETTQLGNDLENFGSAGMFKQADYEYLTKRYYLSEVRLWLTAERYRTTCDDDLVTILYFFDNGQASKRQGPALTEVRQAHQGEVYVFSFDHTDMTPLVRTIASDFNITTAPSLLIDGERVITGYTPTAELEDIVQQRLDG